MEQRKMLGFQVVIFLIVFSVLVYLAKQKIWSRIEH
jgi:ubiquinol-cytochrome c reductase cytochrome c1 subunit